MIQALGERHSSRVDPGMTECSGGLAYGQGAEQQQYAPSDTEQSPSSGLRKWVSEQRQQRPLLLGQASIQDPGRWTQDSTKLEQHSSVRVVGQRGNLRPSQLGTGYQQSSTIFMPGGQSNSQEVGHRAMVAFPGDHRSKLQLRTLRVGH